jgi:hypothetical protein
MAISLTASMCLLGSLSTLFFKKKNIHLFGQVRLVFCVQTSFEILDQAALIPAQQKVTSMVVFQALDSAVMDIIFDVSKNLPGPTLI